MAGLVATACKRSPEADSGSTTASSRNTNERLFHVKGIVKAVRPRQKEIEIKHEAIPDYMPAMTMPFDVKDTNELIGLAPDQSISFRLTVTDTEGWVDDIQKLGPRPKDPGSTAGLAGPCVRLTRFNWARVCLSTI